MDMRIANTVSLSVANTILQQIGGRRFVAMTGAKSFVGGDDFLSFKLPSNFAKDGINYVKITLAPNDTYTIDMMRLRGMNATPVWFSEDIYADVLRDVIERHTGLSLTL
jgi:hypothetical protein